MTRAAIAGLLYFAAVFALGFAAGVVRRLVLVPRLGETAAVLLELPVMLGASWLLARRVARWCALDCAAAPRLLMGGIAFLLLMAAEHGLGALLGGNPPAGDPAARASPADALGLAAQVAFALFPFLQRRASTTIPNDSRWR